VSGTNIGGRSVITPKITASMEKTIKVHRGVPSTKPITIHVGDTCTCALGYGRSTHKEQISSLQDQQYFALVAFLRPDGEYVLENYQRLNNVKSRCLKSLQ